MKKILQFFAFVFLASSAQAQCTDLFFSEYIEGSSNNKAVEIYNPTSGAIDLSDYTVNTYFNGSTSAGQSITLTGMLAAGDVYVIATGNTPIDPAVLNEADVTSSIANYNGDDAVELYKISTATTIDVIGEIGVDPGSSWSLPTSGSTQNNTLVRAPNIQGGTSVWTVGQNQWIDLPQDTFDSLGMHTMIACGSPCTPTASSITETACDSYIAPDGMTYTATGMYTATITNVAGCDSVISIDLTINSATSSSLTEVVCDSFQLNGTTYTFSGTYTQTLTNAIGCDSVITLTLDVTTTPAAPTVNGTLIYCDGDTPTALTISGAAVTDSLIISGVMDATLTGGLPKVIELYAIEDIADLSTYGFGSANNGQGSDGEEFTFPAVAVTSGTYIHIATDSANFNTFMGFFPDYVSGAAAINGDDAIELFHNGAVIDVFGDINVDGTGEAWEYLDGWAYRKDNAIPNGGTFAISEWEFSGINALDGQATNAGAPTPFPVQTYSFTPQIFTYDWYDDAGLTNNVATGNSYTPAITTGMASYYVTATNSGASTCTSVATQLDVSFVSPPAVTLDPQPTVCDSDAAFSLSGGMPAGGTYSGTGVTNGDFDPSVAGVGTVTITYTYVETFSGCTVSETADLTVQDCASISELDAEGIAIFPNPASDVLNIQTETTINEISIVDLSGMVVANGTNNTISVANLASGMYVIHVTTEGGAFTKTFVKK